MSVEFLDGPTVTEFVNDTQMFEKWADEKFKSLDANGDGVLRRDKLQKRPGKFSSMEFELQSMDEIKGLYDLLFDKFDLDKSGSIKPDQFRALMKEIMLAKARGIGNSPICIILQEDSMLMGAVRRANPR
ncbi:UNVERIFIED_CONTAM: hypothetical protein Sradi_1072200 [Sesamum radiatum]|uniref:EF-hand domain-containing protein n=1 Tax=Sesamum radiatum TaxID=300843 RepID=A0AAW2V7A2_SESRA